MYLVLIRTFFESSTVDAASRLTVRSLMAVFTVMVTIWTVWIDKVGIIDAKLESLLSLCVCFFSIVSSAECYCILPEVDRQNRFTMGPTRYA